MGLEQAVGRRLPTEPNMRSVLMVIANVLMAKAQQMSLMERNDMIQHLEAAAGDYRKNHGDHHSNRM